MGSIMLCRLCALERDNFVKIYEDEGQKLNLATKITQCLQIWLYPEDPLPKTVCMDCCTELEQCFNFFEKTSRAQLSLQVICNRETPDDSVKKEEMCDTLMQDHVTNYADTSVTNGIMVDGNSLTLDEQCQDSCSSDDDDDENDNYNEDNDAEGMITSNTEAPQLLECVLSDKDSNQPQNSVFVNRSTCGRNLKKKLVRQTVSTTVTSRRKRCVPVKRLLHRDRPVSRGRYISARKDRAERAAKIQAEKKVKENRELEEEEEKIEKVLEEIAMGKDISINFEAVQNDPLGDDKDFKGPPPLEMKIKKKILRGHLGSKKKKDKPDLILPKPPRAKAILEGYPWQCTECPVVMPTLQELRSHYQTVHSQSPNFKCIQCGKIYTRYRSFARHVKIHRNPKKYKCDLCGKCFSQKTVLQSHYTVHSDARPHVCPQCGKAFKQFSSLYLHSKCHLPDQAKPKFPCDICHKDFATKHTLETHRKIHTGERNFICDICGKSFIAKGSLDYHILTHSGDKPHNCPVCGKGFKTARLLGKHATLHTGIKPHQCDVCGKQFRERGALREHTRIHTGAMPYTCEFCGKNFRFKGILTVHRRQHTGERPYSCAECRREFTNWANYNKHMKRRHRNGDSNVSTTTRNSNRIYQPSSVATAPVTANSNKMMMCSSPDTVYNLSNHITPDNSNSSVPQGAVYIQHPDNVGTAVMKMAAANIYGAHINTGNNKMATMYHHVGTNKMNNVNVMFHTQQDNSQDSVNSTNNTLMGTYHIPSYMPTSLPMGNMSYYIQPIHHADPSMEMLQHRMTNSQ